MKDKQLVIEDGKWEALLKELPGVTDVRINRDETGKLTEIHILASTKRQAKQIVRDVTSALAAHFNADVDYRMISVAQVKEETNPNKHRIKVKGLNLNLSEAETETKVVLSLGSLEYAGKAKDDMSKMGRNRSAALATLDALNSMLPDNNQLTLNEINTSVSGGKAIVLVNVTLRESKNTNQLIGCCNDLDDCGLSAVKAVLNAVNRKIEVLI